MFICRVCGHNSYSALDFLNGLFKCDKCSVIFVNPKEFGSISEHKQGNTQELPLQKRGVFPSLSVSKPIKINRKH